MYDFLSENSQLLYQWLIAPIVADLQRHKIQTLVYLPDGVLRKIPFALLHDGHHYLAEKYALVTVPSLSMLAKPSVDVNKKDILLAGMSEAGPVVDALINSGIDIFTAPIDEQRQLQLRELRLAQTPVNSNERAVWRHSVKQKLALPGVTQELQILSTISDVNVLENEDFILEQFKQEVHQGHAIVHIASHGYFANEPEQSFIMTYDQLLNMNQLTAMFQTEALHNRPIELVSLSACQTATGDDRSPLGLSGVVVQAGVKSAIGTLWPVADDAAKQFFADFYTYYQKQGISKAQALQKAQLQLLQSKQFKHPFFWAPFILVGEWH